VRFHANLPLWGEALLRLHDGFQIGMPASVGTNAPGKIKGVGTFRWQLVSYIRSPTRKTGQCHFVTRTCHDNALRMKCRKNNNHPWRAVSSARNQLKAR